MKSYARRAPAKELSFELATADLAATGFWWCRRCGRVTELLDSDQGVTGQRCVHCHSLKVEWKPGTGESGPVSDPGPLPQWADPPDPRPMQKLHRLPVEKRDLRMLARCGYWFCYGCNEITEPTAERECSLCGAAEEKVQWNEPVFVEAAK
jgi:hypothetical protein